jgi:hypothetical protein
MRSLFFASTRWFLAVLIVTAIVGWPARMAQATVLKLSSGVVVTDFRVSPDSQHVVYKARPPAGTPLELYRSALSGGGQVKISVPISDSLQIGNYLISSDSQWVVYTVPIPAESRNDLYSVPITGTATDSVKLNPPPVAGGSVGVFGLARDRVIYRADQDMDNVYELYSAPIDGSTAPTKLNQTLPFGGDVNDNFQISPDATRVVYTADQDTDEVIELYSVPVAGPASSGIKLNPALVTNGDVNHPFLPVVMISADSSRVIYLADQVTDDVTGLFSVPINSGISVQLNGVSDVGGNSGLGSYRISPDSDRVIYTAVQDGTTRADLYSVPINGPAASGVRLNDPLADSNSVSTLGFMGGRAVYTTGSVSWNIYSVPPAGPASSNVMLATSVEFYQIRPNLSHVVYYKNGIFSVPVNGPSSGAIQIAALPLAGYLGYRVSPDNTRVAYLGTPAGTNELFSVGISQPYSDSIKISGVITPGGTVEYYGGFDFTPDGTRVVYRASQDSPMTELYVTDGGYLWTNRVYLPLMLK